jgi:acetoin:2,6-dichlorophenolindophenol oxidoreductase subunit beta
MRELSFSQAILEATDVCMAKDPCVQIMGLGVPDPKGIFGTTLGLVGKYGPERVSDLPTSENGMTGVAIGCALAGMRPIITHHRLDFALLTLEQLVNQAAKWHYMFSGQMRVPLVVRLLVGRGWGQGPQHSHSLQAWFAHIPGLHVLMPANAHDAKGLLISAIESDSPTIFIEHRWLYGISGPVPEGVYRVPIGRARRVREGGDATVVAISHMALEAFRAAEELARHGIEVDLIDLRSLRPWDDALVLESVRKTGRLLVADTGWVTAGFGAEVVAHVAEHAFADLAAPPRRLGLPDCPTPTSPALAAHFYPRAKHIAMEVASLVGRPREPFDSADDPSMPLDGPDRTFTGPF